MRVMEFQYRAVAESLVIAAVLTAATYLIGLGAGWITTVDWLEVAAVSTSYACTYLCVVQARSNYLFGVVTTALYFVLLWRAELYASATFNGLLTFWLAYGWFRWGPDRDTRAVTWILRDAPVWSFITVTFSFLFWLVAMAISESVGGAVPWADAFILAGSVLAQVLLDNKRMETWIIWAAVDVAAIWVYGSAGLPLVALQYLLFLANTGLGAWAWSRDARTLRELAS